MTHRARLSDCRDPSGERRISAVSRVAYRLNRREYPRPPERSWPHPIVRASWQPRIAPRMIEITYSPIDHASSRNGSAQRGGGRLHVPGHRPRADGRSRDGLARYEAYPEMALKKMAELEARGPPALADHRAGAGPSRRRPGPGRGQRGRRRELPPSGPGVRGLSLADRYPQGSGADLEAGNLGGRRARNGSTQGWNRMTTSDCVQ